MTVADDARERIRQALDQYRNKVECAEAKARAPKKPRKHDEANTQQQIIKALHALPGVWVSRNTVGVGRYATGGIVSYGLGKGSADILCVVSPRGRAVWLEVKSATGRQTPEQATFQARQEALGAVYRVCRSVKEALDAIEEARRGP